ncbi:FtsX-like permease family protein [Nocardioides sp. CER19]|uniref:FtsX-like permease family protein n=1 Tax=Nocardioides sp. CER19 TaxID=3038538 RepID=UPI00244769AD|nr:FtsX-like permease family protein [Nocardioides sp. CER19]MDH2413487.1 hypothetical protein [Nocardioides sp. CER19]
MIRLGVRLAFSGGWGRPALLAACTAVVSGLLLVAVALLRVRGYAQEPLWTVAAEPGTRGGMVFAVVMLGLPPLLLLYQAVRLGTARRERRLAALRLAGATPGEVRAVGAVEVGVPALLGSLLGIGVYLLLRQLLGTGEQAATGWFVYADPGDTGSADFLAYSGTGPGLVPTLTMPLWWQYVAVVGGVTMLGVAVGLMAGRGVRVTPLGVVRRAPKGAPRPWGLLLVVAGLAVGAGLIGMSSGGSQVLGVTCVALLLLGVVSLSSWSAALVGRRVAARASRAHVLLAARRLATDPRSSARAGAAVGGIALVAGGSAGFLADVRYSNGGD